MLTILAWVYYVCACSGRGLSQHSVEGRIIRWSCFSPSSLPVLEFNSGGQACRASTHACWTSSPALSLLLVVSRSSLGCFFLMNLYYIYSIHVWHVCPRCEKWRSEDNLCLSFYYLSSRDPTQVLGLGGNFPYPLSHLTSPFEEIPRTEPSTLWLLRKQKALYPWTTAQTWYSVTGEPCTWDGTT